MLRVPCCTHLDFLDCPFAFIPFRLPSVPLRYDCTRSTGRPGIEGVRGRKGLERLILLNRPRNTLCGQPFRTGIIENPRGLGISRRAPRLPFRIWAGKSLVAGSRARWRAKTGQSSTGNGSPTLRTRIRPSPKSSSGALQTGSSPIHHVAGGGPISSLQPHCEPLSSTRSNHATLHRAHPSGARPAPHSER